MTGRREFLLASAALLAGSPLRPLQAQAATAAAPAPIAVDDREVIELTKALSRIPSFTTEEQEVARFLDALFTREGLQSQVMEVDPGRVQVIARMAGSGGGRSLMLN